MSASVELQIGHVIDENLSLPKKSCFLAFPIYCLVRDFNMFIVCAYVIMGLCQNLLDSSLLIFGFVIHLLTLGNWVVIISRLFSRSYFLIYVCRHRIGPLSGHCVGPSHMSFWYYNGVV